MIEAVTVTSELTPPKTALIPVSYCGVLVQLSEVCTVVFVRGDELPGSFVHAEGAARCGVDGHQLELVQHILCCQ
jgi:hypothetical protein